MTSSRDLLQFFRRHNAIGLSLRDAVIQELAKEGLALLVEENAYDVVRTSRKHRPTGMLSVDFGLAIFHEAEQGSSPPMERFNRSVKNVLTGMGKRSTKEWREQRYLEENHVRH